ncbi:transposase [Candidatus Peregrinibacteria bacterium]|nr:transposase [Candidatus Peregrinibacteria bacterium]
MIGIRKAFKNARLMKALTGLTAGEFSALPPAFMEAFGASRKRRGVRVGYGRHHTLIAWENKLFYILFYVKCYPTFDLASFVFGGVDRARTHEWAHEFLPVLEKALKRKIVLPERKMRIPEEFFGRFLGIKEIWIDGTERPVKRPKDGDGQKKRYSGKKKRHTVKNMIVSDRKKRILMVSRTRDGRQHDYSLFKKFRLPRSVPEQVKCWLDSGFQGVQKDFPELGVRMPKRAAGGHPLTEREKGRNKKISERRVLVENAIAGVKRFRSLTDVCRNRIGSFEDRLIPVGAGLWNLHPEMS